MKKVLRYAVAVMSVFSLILPLFGLSASAEDKFNIITMRPGVDNNSFSNSESDFVGENEKSKYYITAIELNNLTEGESEDTENLILSQALSRFDGACYGISATMALASTGRVDIPKSNYYSINLNEDTFFKKRINYYQLAQYCENKAPAVTKVVENGKVYEDSLRQIVEYAKNGDSFLISFRIKTLTYTVVVCGYEYDGSGTHRVRILDCDKKDDYMFLTVSAGYNSWKFENSSYKSEDVTDLYFSTLEAFSPLSFDDEDKTVYSAVSSSMVIDTVCTNMSSSFTLTNSKGETLTFNKGEITGDITADILKYIANSNDEFSTKVVFTIDDSDEYTVTNNGEEIDLTVVGDNGLFFTVQGKNIKKIFSEEGKITIEGENMEYSVNALSTDDSVDMVNVTGADPDKISFRTKNGLTVSDSANGKIHVSIISSGQMYENDFTIDDGSHSVYYSDFVKTNHVSGSGSPVMVIIVLIFVAAVFAVTLIYTVKKCLCKKSSSKKG